MKTKKTFQIREYQAGDEKALLKVFNDVFIEDGGDNHIVMSESDWQWKFPNSPFGFRILVAIGDNQEIVGQFAMQRNKFKNYNNFIFPYYTVDLCLKKEYRNHNFVSRCYQEFLSQSGDIFLGFPSAGWANIYPTIIPRTKTHHIPIFGRKLTANTIPSVESDVQTKQITSKENCFNELWAKKEKEITIGGIRDSNYLDWRFLQNPQKFELYLIWRQEKPIGYFALDQKNSLTLVNDILILNEHLSDGLKALIKTAADRQSQEIRLMTTNPRLQTALRQENFKEYQREEINQSGYFVCCGLETAQIDDFYLTWADSDWYLHH